MTTWEEQGKSESKNGKTGEEREAKRRGAACCAPAWLDIRRKTANEPDHPQKEKGELCEPQLAHGI